MYNIFNLYYCTIIATCSNKVYNMYNMTCITILTLYNNYTILYYAQYNCIMYNYSIYIGYGTSV